MEQGKDFRIFFPFFYGDRPYNFSHPFFFFSHSFRSGSSFLPFLSTFLSLSHRFCCVFFLEKKENCKKVNDDIHRPLQKSAINQRSNPRQVYHPLSSPQFLLLHSFRVNCATEMEMIRPPFPDPRQWSKLSSNNPNWMTSSLFTPSADFSQNQHHHTVSSPSTIPPSSHSIYNQGISDSHYPNVTPTSITTPAMASTTALDEEEGEEGEEQEVLEMSSYWVERLSKSWGHKNKQGKKK